MRLVRLPGWSFYDCLFRDAVMRGAGDYGRAYSSGEGSGRGDEVRTEI